MPRFKYQGLPFRWRGGGARPQCGSDEVFTISGGFGSYNISKVREWIARAPHRFDRVLLPIDQSLIDYIWRKNDPDVLRLAEMTRADVDRRFSIAVYTGQKIVDKDEIQLIDGNHYILKCWEFGLREHRCVMVPASLNKFFQLWAEVLIDGTWRRIAEEDLLEATRGMYVAPADNPRGYIVRNEERRQAGGQVEAARD